MKVTFIGGGNMGEAILAALLEKKLCRPGDITVSEIIDERRKYLKNKYNVTVTGDIKSAISGKNVIILAVKPQHMAEVLAALKGRFAPDQLMLSIAAGVKINTISNGTGHDKVVRSMPNTPAQIGLGMTGWTATSAVSGEQKDWARRILGAMGKEIYFTDEKALDMVTAVSGSGPAYVYLFAESLITAAVDIGLSPADAGVLVKQTVLGAAQLLDNPDKEPAELRRNVTSKGGTTERALQSLTDSDLAGIMAKAVRAAYQRAVELGES